VSVQHIPVPLADGRAYEVLVGRGILAELGAVIADAVPKAKRIAIVTEAAITAATTWPGRDAAAALGRDHQVFTIDGGEDRKNLATIEQLCSAWSRWGLTRNDVVVGFGGGLVTDVAGFAAASYHRGTAVVHVPTSLLGMIDAAIGGKTGVNIAEGKNLVGAFWQPSAVVCDVDLLATVPPREIACGLGEMAKYHVIDPVRLPRGSSAWPMEDRVAACVAIKAEIVASDEREGGRRAILNYGHTLAHALEIAAEFDLRHGEAVAIGMLYAAEVAEIMGRITPADVAEQRAIVASYDLRSTVPSHLDTEHLIMLMGRDKKATDSMTFVLDGPKGVETVVGVGHDVLTAAMERMR
jgi:5-deoxy-5-amino-3-dehydroquinate synthase